MIKIKFIENKLNDNNQDKIIKRTSSKNILNLLDPEKLAKLAEYLSWFNDYLKIVHL